MTGAIDITKSEKGLLALVLIVLVTVLAFLGKVSWGDVLSFYEWIFTAYVAGKTVQGVAAGGGNLKDTIARLLTPNQPSPPPTDQPKE